MSGVSLAVRARRGAGPGRAERRGQVDAGEAAAPLLRPARRPDPAGRTGPSRADPRVGARQRRAAAAGDARLRRDDLREHRVRAARRDPRHRWRRAAIAADAHDFIAALPDGYETEIGQKGRRLSGGQRQRIAIARAMVRDAPVLILDEPTTGVDAESGSRIMGPLRRLMGGRTTIVISHNLVTVRDADRIAVLEERPDHGSSAPMRSCWNDGGTYERLYRLHHLGSRGLSRAVDGSRRWSCSMSSSNGSVNGLLHEGRSPGVRLRGDLPPEPWKGAGRLRRLEPRARLPLRREGGPA